METNDNENTLVQNLWDTAKAVLRGKYIAIQTSLKRIEKSKMRFLYSHLKKPELEQKNRPNPHTRRQLIKIRAEANELETRSTVEQINRTRRWFLERINKIDKPLTRLIQKNRERTQINKKLWMTRERLQPTPMKYEGSLETFINSFMAIN